MLEAFVDELFPVPISVGSTGGPEFSTDIAETASGYEYRNSNWGQPRHRYDVTTGVTSMEDLMLVKQWHMSMRGRAIGFRFRDPQDFSSAPDGYSDPGYHDQVIGIGDGENRVFHTEKHYAGFVREITKIEPGSLLVAVNGTPTTAFEADYNKGVITMAEPPAEGAPVTAGFLFDVPVRFESDAFTARWDDVNLVSGNISLVELRIRR